MFVLIIGPPRSGTSLMVDLVRECGLNFGTVTEPSDSRPKMKKRSPRNEHRSTMKGKLPNNPENKLKHFEEAKINANKIVNSFHKWFPFFVAYYDDLRIIVMKRNPKAGIKSVAELTESWDDAKRESFWMDRRKWAQEIADSKDYNTLLVHFESLLAKNDAVLKSLIDFVDGKTTIEALKKHIKPGLSKNE